MEKGCDNNNETHASVVVISFICDLVSDVQYNITHSQWSQIFAPHCRSSHPVISSYHGYSPGDSISGETMSDSVCGQSDDSLFFLGLQLLKWLYIYLSSHLLITAVSLRNRTVTCPNWGTPGVNSLELFSSWTVHACMLFKSKIRQRKGDKWEKVKNYLHVDQKKWTHMLPPTM